MRPLHHPPPTAGGNYDFVPGRRGGERGEGKRREGEEGRREEEGRGRGEKGRGGKGKRGKEGRGEGERRGRGTLYYVHYNMVLA